MTHEDLAERLRAILLASPRLARALRFVRELDLAQALLVSGCLYQTVWNALTGREADYGIKDFDLFYFDPDLSWEAEDRVIKRVASKAPPDLAPLLEVRNQARVHLWFEAKHQEPYAPLASSEDSLKRFLCPAFAVGARLEPDGDLRLTAPFGLEDCFALRLRKNPLRPTAGAGFQKAVASCRARWPEVEVID